MIAMSFRRTAVRVTGAALAPLCCAALLTGCSADAGSDLEAACLPANYILNESVDPTVVDQLFESSQKSDDANIKYLGQKVHTAYGANDRYEFGQSMLALADACDIEVTKPTP